MKAKLFSYTKAAEEFEEDFENAIELIAYCARVSNPSNQFDNETAEKLVRYLIKHKHWSPLEMASATLEIETTRDIARQLLRHRSFYFQEFSQRYADPTSDLSFVLREARLQDAKNRQNSVETNDLELQIMWEAYQEDVIRSSTRAYDWAIARGIAKEQARAVLPEGNTVSRLYVHGTLRSWVHYIELRSENGTQKEHRELARACAAAISKIFSMVDEFVSK